MQNGNVDVKRSVAVWWSGVLLLNADDEMVSRRVEEREKYLGRKTSAQFQNDVTVAVSYCP